MKEIDTWEEIKLIKENKDEMFEIAICQLVFNNESVLELLVKRGGLIKAGNHKELDKINKKIQKLK